MRTPSSTDNLIKTKVLKPNYVAAVSCGEAQRCAGFRTNGGLNSQLSLFDINSQNYTLTGGYGVGYAQYCEGINTFVGIAGYTSETPDEINKIKNGNDITSREMCVGVTSLSVAPSSKANLNKNEFNFTENVNYQSTNNKQYTTQGTIDSTSERISIRTTVLDSAKINDKLTTSANMRFKVGYADESSTMNGETTTNSGAFSEVSVGANTEYYIHKAKQEETLKAATNGNPVKKSDGKTDENSDGNNDWNVCCRGNIGYSQISTPQNNSTNFNTSLELNASRKTEIKTASVGTNATFSEGTSSSPNMQTSTTNTSLGVDGKYERRANKRFDEIFSYEINANANISHIDYKTSGASEQYRQRSGFGGKIEAYAEWQLPNDIITQGDYSVYTTASASHNMGQNSYVQLGAGFAYKTNNSSIHAGAIAVKADGENLRVAPSVYAMFDVENLSYTGGISVGEYNPNWAHPTAFFGIKGQF